MNKLNHMKYLSLVILLIIIIFIPSCRAVLSISNEQFNQMDNEETGNRELTICLGYEPRSLYPYQASSQAAQEVLQAIYDGPIDVLSSGQIEPVILEKMPDLSDGSAYFAPVSVSEGDEVVNTYGDLVALQTGTRVFPSGCTSPTCAVDWDGISELQVDQLTATFELMGGLKWSDGQILSASDSLYAYQVASDPATPIGKRAINQTASYTVMDDTTVEWVGKPGLVTDAFEQYFWAPMPEHAWGEYSADELLEVEKVNRSPLGWGAYVVNEWQPGAFIRLQKNPYYFRADEGLPVFDFLTFKITNPNGDTNISNLKFNREPFEYFDLDIGPFDNEIRENGCDLISTTSDMRDQLSVLNILTNYHQDPSVNLYKRDVGDQDILFFNQRDTYESFIPDLSKVKNPLTYPELRTAITFCMNSENVNKKVFYGLIDISPEWSLINPLGKNSNSVFNPVKGSEMLEAMGWIDHDENKNTGRIVSDFHDIPDGAILTFSYLIIDSKDNLAAVYIYKESLAECGIDIIIKPVPAEQFWNPALDTSIFQGHFDLAQVKWSTIITNPCPLLTSSNIPNEENGYTGLNFSGLSSPLIDTQCAKLDESAFKYEREQALDNIQQLIVNDKSMLKLYAYHEILVTRNDFCGVKTNLETGLSNIEEFDYGINCH